MFPYTQTMSLWNTVLPFSQKGNVREEGPFLFLSTLSSTFVSYIETISEEHHSNVNLIAGKLCGARKDIDDGETAYGFRTKKNLENQHFKRLQKVK